MSISEKPIVNYYTRSYIAEPSRHGNLSEPKGPKEDPRGFNGENKETTKTTKRKHSEVKVRTKNDKAQPQNLLIFQGERPVWLIHTETLWHSWSHDGPAGANLDCLRTVGTPHHPGFRWRFTGSEQQSISWKLGILIIFQMSGTTVVWECNGWAKCPLELTA